MELARVEFDYVPGDAVEASMHLTFRNPVLHKQRQKTFWVLLAIGISCLGVTGLDLLNPRRPLYPLSVATMFAGVIVLVKAIQLRASRQQSQEKIFQQYYNNPQCAGIFGPRIISVFPDYLQIDSSLVHQRYHWPAVTSTDQTDDHLFVIFFGSVSIPIPRDAFPTDDAFDRFCEVVHQVRTAATPETTNSDA